MQQENSKTPKKKPIKRHRCSAPMVQALKTMTAEPLATRSGNLPKMLADWDLGRPADPNGITPKDFLLNLMRCEQADLDARVDAAAILMPYFHERVADQDPHAKDGVTVQIKRIFYASELPKHVASRIIETTPAGAA